MKCLKFMISFQMGFVLFCFCCVLDWIGFALFCCVLDSVWSGGRGFWMGSFCSFNSFKMTATQILLWKLYLFSLMILRSFSMRSPELCKDPKIFPFQSVFFSFGFWMLFVFMLCFWKLQFCCSLGVFPFLFSLNREQPGVDFKKIGAHVHQFKGSSSRYT